MTESQSPLVRWKPLETASPAPDTEAKASEETRSHWEAIFPIDLGGHISGETHQSGSRFTEIVQLASGLKEGRLGNVDLRDLRVEIHALTNTDAMGLSGWRLKKAGGNEFEATGGTPQPEPEAGDQGELELTHVGTENRITLGLLEQPDKKRHMYKRYSVRLVMSRPEPKPEETPKT